MSNLIKIDFQQNKRTHDAYLRAEETGGIKIIRANMRAYDLRNKRLRAEKEKRNNSVTRANRLKPTK